MSSTFISFHSWIGANFLKKKTFLNTRPVGFALVMFFIHSFSVWIAAFYGRFVRIKSMDAKIFTHMNLVD